MWTVNFAVIFKAQAAVYFLSGLWVQCHVLHHKWSWRWWKTDLYAACCCTGDTQLGSVCYISDQNITMSQSNHTMDQTSMHIVDGASLELEDMLCYPAIWLPISAAAEHLLVIIWFYFIQLLTHSQSMALSVLVWR